MNGAANRSSIPPPWVNSPATGPSPNTPATSGRCRPTRSEPTPGAANPKRSASPATSMDLFDQAAAQQSFKDAPLAERMRPCTLSEYVGQEHLLGPGKLLRRMIETDQLASLIFWGPPGSGKTTLARVIANATRAHFIFFS